MANTYTSIIIQMVFAVKYRRSMVHESFREELEKYMCGIVTQLKSKPLAIYCNPDHCHFLFGINPSKSPADMANGIKSNSSKWINERNLTAQKFAWQEGYGAFSYSRSHLDRVTKYIHNQPIHHQAKSFRSEYNEMLTKFEIEHSSEYLFEFMD